MKIVILLISLLMLPEISAQTAEEHRKSSEEAAAKGNYKKALSLIEKSIALDSGFAEYYLLKGHCLEGLNLFQDAYNAYTFTVLMDPTMSSAYNARGLLLQKLGQFTASIEDITLAIQIAEKPEFKAWYLNNRGVSKGFIRDHEGKLQDLQEALLIDSNFVSGLSTIAGALSDLGRHQEAIQYLKKATQLDTTRPGLISNLGFTYQKLKQHSTAIVYFNKAIEMDPKISEPFCNRGYSYLQLGMINEAMKDVNKAIKLRKTNAYAFRVRAEIHLKNGKTSEACSDLNQAAALRYSDIYGNEVEELLSKHCKL